MKKPFTLICLVVLGLNCAAQNKKVMEFYLHGEQQLVVNMSGIDSVVWVARDTAPDEPQPEAIDLGLSVKWASFNVGAKKPEEYGDYFEWGEPTTSITILNESTYRWYDINTKRLTKYCTDPAYGIVDNKKTLDPEDDAAHVAWGKGWRIPTIAQIDELITKCNWRWTTFNGINGYIVSSKKNSNYIFLPAAGLVGYTGIVNCNIVGSYWSRSLFTDYSYDKGACLLSISSEEVGGSRSWSPRYIGRSIRPVCK